MARRTNHVNGIARRLRPLLTLGLTMALTVVSANTRRIDANHRSLLLGGFGSSKYLYKDDPDAMTVPVHEYQGPDSPADDFLQSTRPRVVKFYSPYCVSAFVGVLDSGEESSQACILAGVSTLKGSLYTLQVDVYEAGQRDDATLSSCGS
jgi:hypothetical protein